LKRGSKIAAAAAAIPLLGLVIAWSGLLPLGASSGHFALTRWLVESTKRRTVKARSLSTPMEGAKKTLDDPAQIRLGAGYFQIGCRSCHEPPGAEPARALRYMLPRPAHLVDRVGLWEPEELFWIVRHGLKFTGMPGWPSQGREDEVWAVVSFLRRMPEMDVAEYRQVAGLDLEPPEDAPRSFATCVRCHGVEGESRGATSPRLAGQSTAYLEEALNAYASGRRFSGIMETVAAALSEGERAELARYLGELPEPPPGEVLDLEAVERGRKIALRGVPEKKIPSCADCHGPTTLTRKPAYPHLAGLSRSYIELQLGLFREGRRGGSPYARLMNPVARHLSKEEAEDVAHYYASLSRRIPGQ
jgi:cytochrome c553